MDAEQRGIEMKLVVGRLPWLPCKSIRSLLRISEGADYEYWFIEPSWYQRLGLIPNVEPIEGPPYTPRYHSSSMFEESQSGTPFGPVGGGGRPPQGAACPPQGSVCPTPPPHSPVWVFSFEKLRKSAIYIYVDINKLTKNNDYEKYSKLKKIYIKFDEKIKRKEGITVNIKCWVPCPSTNSAS